MPIRTTTMDNGQRAQTSISRATMRKADDKHLWQEVDVDVMASETHTGVERAQAYGFTNVPAKQDEEEGQQGQQKNPQGDGSAGGAGNGMDLGQQPQGDAAEPIIAYLNGDRSHPVVLAIDDRRHRLKELNEGDVALYRGKDDRQQMLLDEKGTYISTRDDKVMRVALVPKKKDDKGQQQKQGPQQAGGQQQKQKKEYGQKSALDDNKKSEVAIEQNGTQTYSRHGETYGTQKGGSDSTIHYEKDKKKSSQVTEKHTHIRFRDHRIFNDDEGNWATSPIGIKLDKYCKEG